MTITEIVQAQKNYFLTGETRRLSFRRQALTRLLDEVVRQEEAIAQALLLDLGKSPEESYMTETSIVQGEIRHTLKNLRRWAKPTAVSSPLACFPASSSIQKEPLGNVLILSPWNYPLQLCLVPLVGAIAAGNTALLKPSKSAPHTAQLLCSLLGNLFPMEYIHCLPQQGYSYETILDAPYDFIFFTGSERVGKTIMQAAAKHLTPVCLELGGKSPCIVDETANIPLAARRIMFGKLLNAGQTCVAPDYILVHHSVQQKLAFHLQAEAARMYGVHPLENPSYPRIVNAHHFQRLTSFINSQTAKEGGQYDETALKIAPCFFTDSSWDDPIMQEEIFGPILPIIPYHNLSDIIAKIQSRPKPLALYLFTRSRAAKNAVLSEISFGGGCINDTIMHLTNPRLPFGGVGASGMGRYHGKHSFDVFSHHKGIVRRGLFPDVPLRYQPISSSTMRWIRRFM